MIKGFIGLLGALIATALFLAVNVLGVTFLSSTRVDLTEQNLFTLSRGSKNIAKDLEEPIRLYLYFSEGSGREIPEAKEYHRRVRDVLEGYARHANGNIIVEYVDPEPFSEEEDQAASEGIAAIPTRPDPLYFGLVGTNATDDRQIIPFFGDIGGGAISFERKERFLEYDLSRLIYSLAHPEKKVIGVLSALPLEGSPGNPQIGMPEQPRWRFLDQLGYFMDLRTLSPSIEELPDDLDALLLVHPREFSDKLLYAIDQFVMGGGKLVAMVDPHCEQDFSQVDPSNPMASMGASKSSDLNRLFQAWGFEVVPNKVAADRKNALGMRSQTGAPIPMPVWMDLGEEYLGDLDPVSSLLQNVRIISPGSIRAIDGGSSEVSALLTTSEDAMEVDVGRLMFRADPQAISDAWVSGDQPLTLVARVSGEVASAFPDGDPSAAATAEETAEGAAPAGDHRAASDGPIHLIVFADVDLLHDSLWLQRTVLGGITFGESKSADNCDLLLNALENMTGGSDLLSIRARGKYSRPFEMVDEIEREAQRKFQDKERELQAREKAMTDKIAELQSQRDTSDPNSLLFLSPEQKTAYEDAMENRRQTRKELRDVRHSMDEDIKALGRKVKALNILALPLLISIVAIGLGAWRIQRRGSR